MKVTTHSYTFKVYIKTEVLEDLCSGTPLLINPPSDIDGMYFLDITVVADSEETAIDVMRDFYPEQLFIIELVGLDEVPVAKGPSMAS